MSKILRYSNKNSYLCEKEQCLTRRVRHDLISTKDMKHLITASILALSAVAMPLATVAARSSMPDVEAIGELSDVPAPAMRAVEGGIELSSTSDSGQVFMVYSITGQLVKKVTVGAASRETVSLPGGCYVVRCHCWSKKIVVR